MTTQRVRAAVLALVGLLALTGCGRIERVLAFGATVNGVDRSVALDPPAKAAKESCAGKTINDDRLAPPAGLLAPDDLSWLLPRPVLGARVYLGWLEKHKGRQLQLQQAFYDEGLSRGFQVSRTPLVGGVSSVSYGGRADVDITIAPYCREYLAVRYVVRRLDESPPLIPAGAQAAVRPCSRAEAKPYKIAGEQGVLPFPSGATAIRAGAADALAVYTSLTPGGPADAARVRTSLVEPLMALGYAVGPASGDPAGSMGLVGRRVGALQVLPFCRGILAVRYQLAGYIERASPEVAARRPCTGRDEPTSGLAPLPAWLSLRGSPQYSPAGIGVGTWTFLVSSSSSKAASNAERGGLARSGLTITDKPGPNGLIASGLTRGPLVALLVVRPACLNHYWVHVVAAQ